MAPPRDPLAEFCKIAAAVEAGHALLRHLPSDDFQAQLAGTRIQAQLGTLAAFAVEHLRIAVRELTA